MSEASFYPQLSIDAVIVLVAAIITTIFPVGQFTIYNTGL